MQDIRLALNDRERNLRIRQHMKEISGRCLCGAVEYSVPDDFAYMGFCHCSECRRFSGSAFSAMGGIAVSSFRVVKGREDIAHYRKSEDTVLGFCRVCGSSLYAEKPQTGMIHLRLGTLDAAPSITPQFHSYVGAKVPWHHIGDALPQFEAGRGAAASQQNAAPDSLSCARRRGKVG